MALSMVQQVTSADAVIERYSYDGYDRVIKHRKLGDDGSTKTTQTSYDALDRTSTKTENAGTPAAKTTAFSYLGLSGEVLSEEVAEKITASYQYSPWGARLSQTKYQPDGSGGQTTEDAYYGYNPHTDVETLTTNTGDTKATYGYTAYGTDDETRFTGADKPDPQQPGQEPYNVYRFAASRWDGGSDSYDMGFRDYSPGLNRFLTRDAYNGALADLNLGLDPWNANRYAFTGGNPISRVELDGHINESLSAGGGGDIDTQPETAHRPTFTRGIPQSINQSCWPTCNRSAASGDWKDSTAGLVGSFVDMTDISVFGLVTDIVTGRSPGEAYRQEVQQHGIDTNSTRYEAGVGLGLILPLPVAASGGVGVVAATRAGVAYSRHSVGVGLAWTGNRRLAGQLGDIRPAPNATVGDLRKLSSGNPPRPGSTANANARSDDELLATVFAPRNGQFMATNPFHPSELAQGNHRRWELLRRAEDPQSRITWDTEIFIKNYGGGGW